MCNKSKNIRNFDNAGWLSRRWYVATFLLLLVYHPFFGQMAPKPISIEWISIDEDDNSLKLRCSFANNDMVDNIKNDSTSLRLDIRHGDILFKDVIIKKEEVQSRTSLLLTVQPPLEASIFKTRKREFVLQLLAKGRNEKTDKSAILGSAFKTFDLRPYTHTEGLYLLFNTIALFLIFSIILYLIKPLRQKFRFKRDHVLKYIEVWEEGKSRIDPFTFVDIADHDEVVVIDDQVMLLSSWKRLKKLPDSKPSHAYANFFDQMSPQPFFNPLAEKFGKTDRAWYGLLGILVGWLLFRLFLFLGAGQGELLAGLFDSDALQVSTVITHDFLLGLTMGLCYATVLALVDQLRPDRTFKTSGLVKTIALRATFIAIAFLIQALVTVYFVQNPYINGGIAWCLIGTAFVFPLDVKNNIIKKLLMGLGIGLFSYGVFQLTGMPYLRDFLGTDIPLFIGMAFIGCLASAIPYSRISKKHLAKLKTIKRPDLSLRKIKNSQNRKGSNDQESERDRPVVHEPQKVGSGQ